jgi:hypothetical protein
VCCALRMQPRLIGRLRAGFAREARLAGARVFRRRQGGWAFRISEADKWDRTV